MKEFAFHVEPPVIPDHRLVRRIGEGSYGQVWLAETAMGQYRAVKVIWRSGEGADAASHREVAGLRRFEPISRGHPGVVKILHVGAHPEQLYFYYIMELADDRGSAPDVVPDQYKPRTLRSDILARGRIPTSEAIEIGIALAQGLEHIHAHGLVHRDVKPSNVIFVGGAPKLADIGLVGLDGEARSFVGTEGFVPPEGPGTARADIYALGKLLYETITGKSALLDYPELPADLGVDPAVTRLNRVILDACAPVRERRTPSARAIEDALTCIRSGRRPPVRRRAWLRAAAASIAGTGALALAIQAARRRLGRPASQHLSGILLQTLPLPVTPAEPRFAVAWDEPTNRAFVPLGCSASSVVAVRFGPRIEIAAVLDTPSCTSVDLTPDASRLYARACWGVDDLGAVAYDASRLEPLNEYRGREVTWTPLASAESPTVVYMDQYNDPGAVVKVDFTTGSILTRIPVGAWPSAMTFEPERRLLYVAHGQAGREMNPGDGDPVGISVVDTATDTVIRTLRVNGEPSMSLRVTPDGGQLFFLTRNIREERLYKVAVPECRLLGTLDLPGAGDPGIGVSLDGRFVFVPHRSRDLVQVIDARTLEQAGVLRVPAPDSICPAPDGRHALAISAAGRCLYWIELQLHG